jgi:Ran GTPase-activating protein (RanGAP) involved in mRNA processing and transport
MLLTGLLKQQGFRSLAIHENEFDSDCATTISNLLKKKPNEQLEDLRLSHCRINWKTTQQLLTTLSTQRCFLRKLQLVKANLNEFSTEILGDVLRFARSITHLDISWNAMAPNTMSPLVEILSKNRRL